MSKRSKLTAKDVYDRGSMAKDFTPTGMKMEGPWENDRNACYADLYKAIIREAFNVTDIICAHHLTFVLVDRRDGFDYQVVQEIPSADALIFDHEVAKRLWGDEHYIAILGRLAAEPVASRDELLSKLYYGRASGHVQGPARAAAGALAGAAKADLSS